MQFIKIVTVSATLALAACGTAGNKPQSAAQQPAPTTQSATSQQAAAAPAVLIARVPIDQNGVEQNANVQTVEMLTKPADAASTVAAFPTATSVKVTAELDATSSSQQWGRSWSWRSGNSCNSYGYGSFSYGGWGGCGYNSYNNYNSYQNYNNYWWGQTACSNYSGFNGYGSYYGYGMTSATPAQNVTLYAHIDAFSKGGYNYYLYTQN